MAAEVKRTAIHFLPEAPYLQRVFAGQKCGQAGTDLVGGRCVDDCLGDRGRGIDFAQAGNTFVGMDAHEHAILAAVADGGIDAAFRTQQDRFDLRDTHVFRGSVGEIG